MFLNSQFVEACEEHFFDFFLCVEGVGYQNQGDVAFFAELAFDGVSLLLAFESSFAAEIVDGLVMLYALIFDASCGEFGALVSEYGEVES